MSIKDAFSGNGSSLPHETEITRGTFVAAIIGLVNIAMFILDIPERTQVFLLANMNPAIVIVSAALFAWWDSRGGRRHG